MSELPISGRKFCKNKMGINTKTKIRKLVATPRSNRDQKKEACISREGVSGRSAVVGMPQN